MATDADGGSRGDRVVLRNRREGRIVLAVPATVVEDGPDLVALFVAVGAAIKLPIGADGAPVPRSLSYEERVSTEWRLGDGWWTDESFLWLARPGEAHAVGLVWREPEHAFEGWYVNLQSPLVRARLGFETQDHVLDLLVAPDRTWRWKDEEEFAAAQRLGTLTPDAADAIRNKGHAVVAAIERWGWPFDAGWEQWRPDPGWSVPTLPTDWERD